MPREPIQTLPLCANCEYYSARVREINDECLHPNATVGGVRSQSQLTCEAMRRSQCFQGRLFLQKA